MMGLLIGLHIIVCILLIVIILVQAGRGGGLVENFSSIESMFGTKTNAFLTRLTTILSTLFFITCLSLAFMSIKQSKSLMAGNKPAKSVKQESPVVPKDQAKPVVNQTASDPAKAQSAPLAQESGAVAVNQTNSTATK